jgi:hypothetical protein
MGGVSGVVEWACVEASWIGGPNAHSIPTHRELT